MSALGLAGFDQTVQLTNTWLKELMLELGWKQRNRAMLALRATLHALRDRLPLAEVAQLGAQLPLLLRGAYYEGWRPRAKPVRDRYGRGFVEAIEHALGRRPGQAPVNAKQIAGAVFAVLDRRVSRGEIAQVRHCLPPAIRVLWPEER
jgi:uncharacterized protein (DUF2267 family)